MSKDLEAQLRDINERLKRIAYTTAKLSRYKNDSDELMISAFAYFTIRGLKFTYGTLAAFDKLATRYSRSNGYKVEQTQDPRFGLVNLYDTEVLDAFVPQLANEEE